MGATVSGVDGGKANKGMAAAAVETKAVKGEWGERTFPL